MIKLILSAVWICIITLVSSYVAASWKTSGKLGPSGEDKLSGLNYTKTDPINVPILDAGGVAGYVVAQFVYTADAAVLNRLSVPPDPFILDEAYRTIFSDERIDFHNLDSFDIASLTTQLKEHANARFGIELLQDVLVEQFTFVTKDEVRAQAGAEDAVPVVTPDSATARKIEEERAHEGEGTSEGEHGSTH